MDHQLYRLEALNHDGRPELIKILPEAEVRALAERLDNYYLRIVECGPKPRRVMWQNYTHFVREY